MRHSVKVTFNAHTSGILERMQDGSRRLRSKADTAGYENAGDFTDLGQGWQTTSAAVWHPSGMHALCGTLQPGVSACGLQPLATVFEPCRVLFVPCCSCSF